MSDTFGDESGEETEGMKSVRAALKKANDDKEALAAQIKDLTDKQRLTDVTKLFRDAGVDERAAKFFDKAEATADTVGEWLKENGDLFGLKADQQSNLSPEQQAVADATTRANAVVNQAPAAMTGSLEDIAQKYATLPVEELFKLGLLDKPTNR